MKLSLALSCVVFASVGLFACSSSGGGATPEDFASPGDEADVTKMKSFTCTAQSNSGDFFDNLAVSGTGNSTMITVKDDQGTYTGKIDPTYPNARTTAANQDYRRFRWTKDDPWQDSGSSLMLVHKDILEGKAGTMKYQVTGESFENNFMKCTPKK